MLRRLTYRQLGRANRGAVAYWQRLSGYGRAQVTRLVSLGGWQAAREGITARPNMRLRAYTAADVALLAEVDRAILLFHAQKYH